MIKVKDGYAKLIGTTYKGSPNWVLLSNGGHKPISDFATASGVVTALGTNGNYITWTKNGTVNNLTVPYATKSNKLYQNKDLRTENTLPYASDDYDRSISAPFLRYNSTDGLNDGGTYHTSIIITPWSDNSGGSAHNIGLTNNGNVWIRSGTTEWSNWKKIAFFDEIPTKVSQLTNDSGYLTSTNLTNYVTLNNNLTISGVKTFSTQLKFTVADGTAPFTVTSKTLVANLNADLLDGRNSSDYIAYKNKSINYTEGWYRIAETSVNVGNNIGIFYIYSSGPGYHTNVILGASISYTSIPTLNLLNMTQYSTMSISKARIVYNNSTYAELKAYLDVYIPLTLTSSDGSAKSIQIFVKFVGHKWSLTPIEAATVENTHTTKEISFAKNTIISDYFLGDLIGSASALTTTRKIWGLNFDGTKNVQGALSGATTITTSGNITTGNSTTTSNLAHTVENNNGKIGIFASTRRGLYDYTIGNWLIGTDGTNTRLMIGNVGIGTDSPLYKLHVAGTTSTNLLFIGGSSHPMIIGNGSLLSLGAANSNSKASVVLDLNTDSFRRNSTSTAISLGTATYPWANIYGDTITIKNYKNFINGNISYPNVDDSYKMGTDLGLISFIGDNGNDTGLGITWSFNTTSAHAGIYTKLSGTYGSKMYFATTNAFSHGPKAALEIDHEGNIKALRGEFKGNLTGNAATATWADKLDGLHKDEFQQAVYTYFPTTHSIANTTTLANIIAPNLTSDSDSFKFYDTKFYETASSTSNRAQIAYGYKYDGIHFRRYYNGAWTTWKQIAFTDSNVASADKVDGYDSSVLFTCETGYGIDVNAPHPNKESGTLLYKISSNCANIPEGCTNGVLVNFNYPRTDTAFQLVSNYSNSGLFYRSGNFTDGGSSYLYGRTWRKIAFTDSNITGNAASATITGDDTMTIIPLLHNEINFGGTNNSLRIYFGYRATDSKPIPTSFIFGGSDGSASLSASKFIKSGGTAALLLRADGNVATFNWSGQNGQPTWLWGGDTQHTYYVYNPANFSVNYATSAGNADTLDGEHGSRYTLTLGGPNYVTITVEGDAATYYPVIIKSVSNKYPMLFVNISRGYSETAPDSWNNSTHKGGLTLTLLWNGSRYWDGNGSGQTCYCVYVYESYCTMVGGLGNSTAGKVVWLRGGGAVYHIHAMNGTSVTADVHTSTYTDNAKLSFAPRTTVESYDVRWPGYSYGADKLGSSTIGGTYLPIYLSSGAATAGTSYAKAIKAITRSGTTFTYTCIDGTTGTFTQLDSNTTYPVYFKNITTGFKDAFRTQTKGDANSGNYISAIRCNDVSVEHAPQDSSGIAFGVGDTHGYLYTNYRSAVAYIGGGNANKLNWVKQLAFTSDIPTALKNPNAIKFKNTSGTEVSYDGSTAVDLTEGIYSAKQLTKVLFTSGYDLNTIKTEQVYTHTLTSICNSLLNGPTGRSKGEIRLESVTCGSGNYGFLTLYTRANSNYEIWYRTWNDNTFTSWVKNIHSGNYTDYTVKKDGTGASGTWGINITGNAGSVKGSYTSNGGQQNPNYFGKNKVGFLMMNTTVNNNSSCKDWIIMDCYAGSDVGGAVAFGVNRQSLGAYIMRSASERTSWTESAELLGTHNYNNYALSLSGGTLSGDLTLLNLYVNYMITSSKPSGALYNPWSIHMDNYLWIQSATADGTNAKGKIALSGKGAESLTELFLKADLTKIHNTILFNKLSVPTTSGGSTYGPGSNGQVLKSNGSTVYWANANTSYGYIGTTAVQSSSKAQSLTGIINITASGNIIASGEITAYSDRRLKSNIKPLENRGYIQPMTYIKDNKECIGFIAQDVLEKYPELVNDNSEYLSLNYLQYVAVLQALIIELEKRIKELENGTRKL